MPYNQARKMGLKPGQDIVTIASPSGAKFQVNKALAPQFQGFLNDLEGSGYRINPKTSGGYSFRNKRGGTSYSEHAYGNAIDINPEVNPHRSTQNNLPANVGLMAKKWGLASGLQWDGSSVDPMHFEGSRIIPANELPSVGPVSNPVASPVISPSPTTYNYPSSPADAYLSPTNPTMTGFQDPQGVYPRWPSEDHSLSPPARGLNSDQQYQEGVIPFEEALYGDPWGTVPTAGGGMFDEPGPSDVAQYPDNITTMTKGGHLQEFDSTTGRYRMGFPDGSYIQSDGQGNITYRSEGDSMEFTKNNKRISVQGDFAMSSRGSLKLLSESDAFMEVRGAFTGSFNSNINLNAKGELVLAATGGVRIVGTSVSIESQGGNVELKSSAEINMDSSGDFNAQSGGDMVLDAGGSQVMKAAGDIVSDADGDIKQEAGGNINVKAGGDIKEEGSVYHNSSPEARFKTIRADAIGTNTIAWQNTDSIAKAVGNSGDDVPVIAPDAPESAGDAMTEIAQYNSKRAREGGSSGNNVAPKPYTGGNSEYLGDETRADPVKTGTNPSPRSEDMPSMLKPNPSQLGATPDTPATLSPGNYTVADTISFPEIGENSTGYTAADVDAAVGGNGNLPSRGGQIRSEDMQAMDDAIWTLPPELRADAKAMMYGTVAQESNDSLAQVASNGGKYKGLFQQNKGSYQWGASQLSDEYLSSVGGLGSSALGNAGDAAMAYYGHTYDGMKFAYDQEGFVGQNSDANIAQLGRGNLAEVARIQRLYPDVPLEVLEKGDPGAGIPRYEPKYNSKFFSQMRANPSVMAMNKSVRENRRAVHAKFYKANGIGDYGSRTYAYTLWGSIMKRPMK
jgi:hypothetical protein